MQLYLFMLTGLAFAYVFNIGNIQNDQWYSIIVATLLVAGLYSSTFGISIAEARTHWRLILNAITVGVFLKALIIGSIMALLLQHPVGFVLGIIVAQIDPLSTAALLKGNRMSQKAKTILASWAAFDDPITVIMSLYAPMLVALMVGTSWAPIHGTAHAIGVGGYLTETGVNLLFAAGIFVLWHLLRRYAKAANAVVVVLIALGLYGLVVGSLSVAVYYFWMLSVAIMGLFMRPPIESTLTHAVTWALNAAALLLGILLINGINIGAGIALGLAAYGAQVIVGLLLARKLAQRDRLHIAFAQQNGITAIILALLFEQYYPGTIAIVAPAIITVNVTHAIANALLDAYLSKDTALLTPRHHIKKLRSHLHKI
jgi:NhaP-type Na+/H+ or K+/H+ antiporter